MRTPLHLLAKDRHHGLRFNKTYALTKSCGFFLRAYRVGICPHVAPGVPVVRTLHAVDGCSEPQPALQPGVGAHGRARLPEPAAAVERHVAGQLHT
jgi:hypothetical protein